MTDDQLSDYIEKKLGIVRPPVTAFIHTEGLINAIEDEGYSISRSMYRSIESIERCMQEELAKKALRDENDD